MIYPKKIVRRALILFIFALLIIPNFVSAQTKKIKDGKYVYEIVEGDPLGVRIYTLPNGLTVGMSVYKDEPKIQTYIPIRAGSKNDPADATGLAHYLEHMLFKGTDKFGSKDFETEKVYIEEIINLYEKYRSTTDETERKEIYRQIDSVSLIASQYAIANEYDKMLAFIGAEGTNAWTWVEETVYVNNIPSNQLANWLTIEAERYRNPVMRLFHTELEVVYEEKNRSLDNDYVKAYEKLYEELFKNHQYGTQTTIGTIDHLKNPSIKKVIDYYNTYYVPNNMAIMISGDFDPDEAIRLIDERFGYMQPKEVPEYVPPVEEPITSPRQYEVFGPNAEGVIIGYRFDGGEGTREADLLIMLDMVLTNGKAGLIDLNLNQSQKVLDAGSEPTLFKDYSTLELSGRAREGQSLEQVRDLLLAQIELVKKGDFPDWLPEAIVNNLRLQQTQQYESNGSRGYAMVDAYIKNIPWERYIFQIDRLSKITKQDIVDFANEKFDNNYIAVYKKTGEDPNKQQIEKPEINPVNLNREEKSPFVEDLMSNTPNELQPAFLDYGNDINEFRIKNDVPVYYMQNKENNLFSLYYVFDMGTNNDRKLGTAISYLQFLGTSDYTPAEIQQEFFKLGCSYSVFSSQDQVYVTLNGLSDNFLPALQLFEKLLADAQPNPEALANLVDDILKSREDNKLSKSSIRNAMFSYGKYGPKSPSTNLLSEAELKALKPGELISKVSDLASYKHKIFYYGPLTENSLKDDLTINHYMANEFKPYPEALEFTELSTDRNKVYVVDYDMVQAEIVMISKKDKYDKDVVPVLELYNDYFGTGMSSITFQEMRESKALAYSVFSVMSSPQKKDDHRYLYSYIGTQADKLPEAMAGMMELLNDMPQSENSFLAAKNGIIKRIQSERITKSDVLFNYEASKKLGLDYDIRKDVYEQVPGMTYNDIKDFHDKYVKNSSYTYLVLGSKDKLDIATLSKYGDVEYLTLEDVFGY